jgi:hypothetical protein
MSTASSTRINTPGGSSSGVLANEYCSSLLMVNLPLTAGVDPNPPTGHFV